MVDHLTAHEVFEFLRPDQVNAISEASERVTYAAGDIVYERGAKAHHLYTVLQGQVTLRLPGRGGISIVIDQLAKGEMFGSCVSLLAETYALTAQCTEDSVLLRIKSSALKSLMDKDPVMGYATQSRISEVYFSRYVETMRKLQAIVMNIPIESH